MKDIGAVIFDLDGTLVDSMWIWEQVDREFLEARGREFPDDFPKTIEGMSFSETMQYMKDRFNLDESIEEMTQVILDMTMDLYGTKVGMKSGAVKLLDRIKELNLPMGVGSSNSISLINITLKNNGVKDYFSSIRSACEVAAGKPSPDIFLKVAEDLGVNPNKCVVFEDTVAGAMAGKNAGMYVIGVMDEASAKYKDELIEVSDRYIEDYSQIIDLF